MIERTHTAKKFFKKKVVLASRYYYDFVVKYFSWWPIGLRQFKINGSSKGKRTGYYLWRFPKLSQTFVQREILALVKSGHAVEVVADTSDAVELLDENAKGVLGGCTYIKDIDSKRLKGYQKKFFFQNPIRFFNLFIFVLTRQYTKFKSFEQDLSIFLKAVYLAGTFAEKNVTHVHAPWSDKFAFIALVASRLLGVPFTVQARAGDIYRNDSRYALKEKFENAEIVITNTNYNELHLKGFLSKRYHRKIRVNYNGIDLEQFKPAPPNGDTLENVKILAVGRLVEQKGLAYLLKACKVLLDRGCKFTCEIIGDKEEPAYSAYYLELKKLHRQLELDESVFFLGPRTFEQVMQKYRSCDVVVLPCVIAKNGDRDITPNVLIEAMAMKLPVISTTLSGIPEIVDNGVNGVLVSPGDIGALANAMSTLIKDFDLRKGLGIAGRQKIEEKFDISKNINKYIEQFGEGYPPTN